MEPSVLNSDLKAVPQASPGSRVFEKLKIENANIVGDIVMPRPLRVGREGTYPQIYVSTLYVLMQMDVEDDVKDLATTFDDDVQLWIERTDHHRSGINKEEWQEDLARHRQALTNAGSSDSGKVLKALVDLAWHLNTTPIGADLEGTLEQILLYQRAINMLEDHHPSQPRLIQNVAALYHRLARANDFVSNINAAVAGYRQAMSILAKDHFDQPFLLAGLGSALNDRFRRLNVPSDFEEAQSALRIANECELHHPARTAINSMFIAIHTNRRGPPGYLFSADDVIQGSLGTAMWTSLSDHPHYEMKHRPDCNNSPSIGRLRMRSLRLCR
jgi:hypothetical protein